MKRKNCASDDEDDDFIEDDDLEGDAYIKKMKDIHDEQKQKRDQIEQTKDIAPKAIPCPIHKRNCARRLTKDGTHYYYKCFIHNCKFYKKLSTSKFTEERPYIMKRSAQNERKNDEEVTSPGTNDELSKQKKKRTPQKKTGGKGRRKKKGGEEFPDISGMSMEESALDEYERMLSRESANNPNGEEGDEEKSRRRRSGGFQICDKNHICVRELRCGGIQDMKDTIFKDIPDVLYDPSEREWRFPIDMQDKVVQNYKKAGISCSPVPKEPIRALQNVTKDENTDFTKISGVMLENMFPFQVQGYLFGCSKRGRCMICDEMGLGKTVQGLAIAVQYIKEWPLLIICPSSVKHKWASETHYWIPDIRTSDIKVISNGKDELDAKVNVISYDLIPKMGIKPGRFAVIIADESHYLKNPEATRTKAIIPLLQSARRAILLSGTPALSRPIELYPQLVALNSSIFPSMAKFAMRYCNAFKNQFGWDYTGNSNLKELHTILSETVMIRRLKMDVLNELPSKNRKIVNIDADVSLLPELKEKLEKMGSLRNLGSKDILYAKRGMMMDVFLDSAKVKIKPLIGYVFKLLDEGRKFLVFVHHQSMLDSLENELKKNVIPYIRIDGSTSSKKREEYVNAFQSQRSYRVAILSITAAGTGITLNSADLVVFGELYWTPGLLLQAEDRVHRIGQDRPVEMHYLLARNTIDDIIWPLIEKKLFVLGKAMDGEAKSMKADSDIVRKKPKLEVLTINTSSLKNSMNSSSTNLINSLSSMTLKNSSSSSTLINSSSSTTLINPSSSMTLINPSSTNSTLTHKTKKTPSPKRTNDPKQKCISSYFSLQKKPSVTAESPVKNEKTARQETFLTPPPPPHQQRPPPMKKSLIKPKRIIVDGNDDDDENDEILVSDSQTEKREDRKRMEVISVEDDDDDEDEEKDGNGVVLTQEEKDMASLFIQKDEDNDKNEENKRNDDNDDDNDDGYMFNINDYENDDDDENIDDWYEDNNNNKENDFNEDNNNEENMFDIKDFEGEDDEYENDISFSDVHSVTEELDMLDKLFNKRK